MRSARRTGGTSLFRDGIATPRLVPDKNARASDQIEPLVVESIDAFERWELESLFREELESWHHLRALERARLVRCEPLYVAARSRTRLVAAVPGYVVSRDLAERWLGRVDPADPMDRRPLLILGSPFDAECRAGFGATPVAQRTDLFALLVHAALRESAARGLGGLIVAGAEERLGESFAARALALGLVRFAATPLARLALPRWSFEDYLSALDCALRARFFAVCERFAGYERSWRFELGKDLGAMLALCAAAGYGEITAAYFASLPAARASCLLVRAAGELVGLGLVVHDKRRLRDKLVLVRSGADGDVVATVLWLEMLRFGLECGIESYESSTVDALAVATPHELIPRCGWTAVAAAP